MNTDSNNANAPVPGDNQEGSIPQRPPEMPSHVSAHADIALADSEILELNTLCSAVADETLTGEQREHLCDWLRKSPAARAYYVRAMGLSASLHTYAAETLADTVPDAQRQRRAEIVSKTRGWFVPLGTLRAWWRGLALATAAVAALAVAFFIGRMRQPGTPAPQTQGQLIADNGNSKQVAPEIEVASAVAESVATITGMKDAKWEGADGPRNPGDAIRRGQRLKLASGTVEITFDSGACVTLNGPSVLDVNSAWDGTLRKGLLKASVPHEAIGFRISNSAVDIVDLGTEFSMSTSGSGAADVRVLKGEIEAAPRNAPADRDTLLMRENETMRFDNAGITTLDMTDPAHERLNPEFSLDRFLPETRHYRVSFAQQTAQSPQDKAAATITPTVVGDDAVVVSPSIHAILTPSGTGAPDAGMYSESKYGRALRFNGELYTQAKIPALSSHAAHTIAFWVRVPKDTNLAESYAMIAWATTLPKLNSRPVHISWNRTPTEGTLGAIRTDFGGGCAIGTTSLRDGRWHHIAIIFAPGDTNTPMQVKQYVDGRLESGTIIPGQTRSPVRVGDAGGIMRDILWFGCRLGVTGPREDRFRGEIAEVHITERSLSPLEIVSIMRTNQLAQPAVAAVANK